MGTSDLIVSASAWLCDLPVERPRSDAIQAFLKQETIFVSLTTASGFIGTGYSYTIGTGGHAVLSVLRQGLLDSVIGADATRPEQVWLRAFNSTRSTMPGAITALALAALDTAVWDARSRATGLALWRLLGGASESIPVYDTEGGWLHLTTDDLVAGALESKRAGLPGVKIKVGKPLLEEDRARIAAVREAVGADFDIMVDANQSMTVAEAERRVRSWEPFDLAWFEEPLPAENVVGHARLSRATSTPIAVGETLYSVGQFAEYFRQEAVDIVQVDVGRVGGITPWMKIAHLAESLGVAVAPHFLMELHLPLVCAVPNGLYLERIEQLRRVTRSSVAIVDGRARPSDDPGLGIDWDRDEIDRLRIA